MIYRWEKAVYGGLPGWVGGHGRGPKVSGKNGVGTKLRRHEAQLLPSKGDIELAFFLPLSQSQ
jgi:hypothetical protein